MRKNLAIVFILIFTVPGFAQDFSKRSNVFKRSKYPANRFLVKKRVYPLGNTTVVLRLVQPKYDQPDPEFFMAWLEQWENGKLLKSVFLIDPSSESGIQLPNKQPLPDFFMLNEASEFTGTFYLLHRTGVWYEVPGQWLKMNKAKTKLFTYVPAECGGCSIGKFDVASHKLTTKMWDGTGVAWKETEGKPECFEPFKDNESEWITWKNFK